MSQPPDNICLPIHQIHDYRKAGRNLVTLSPTQSRKKLEKPIKLIVPRSAITLKRTRTPFPSPVIYNPKTINWNMKAGEQLSQKAKEEPMMLQ